MIDSISTVICQNVYPESRSAPVIIQSMLIMNALLAGCESVIECDFLIAVPNRQAIGCVSDHHGGTTGVGSMRQ